jgi:superfamily II DNA helicase RecQ
VEGRLPANVRASVERLRRELRPERGGVDWRPVAARRERATRRLEAIAGYATGRGCLRANLVGYFGERISTCSGCLKCARRPGPVPLDKVALGRFRALRSALAPVRTPWGGALLEAEVLTRLAEAPPPDAAALAMVEGVGPELAASYGRRILEALGVLRTPVLPDPPRSERHELLLAWRRGRALAEGVAPWQVVTDGGVERLAERTPSDLPELGRIAGVGPRALRAYGEELLRLLGGGGDGADA